MPVGTSIGTTSNNIKSLPHTGDLQTKALQGHYLKHVILQESQNISLTNIFYFASYAYRNSIGTISSHFLILVTSKPRLFKVTTSNTWYYKNDRTFLLQMFFYFASYAYRNSIGTISSHFLILVTSKPRLFKVTTSNTWYYKNDRTFLLQIFCLFDVIIILVWACLCLYFTYNIKLFHSVGSKL